MTMNDQELKTATMWIDGAVTLLVKHRRSHDALNLTPCVCTICVSARFLIEHVPMLEPPPASDPRLAGFRDSRGGLPK